MWKKLLHGDRRNLLKILWITKDFVGTQSSTPVYGVNDSFVF